MPDTPTQFQSTRDTCWMCDKPEAYVARLPWVRALYCPACDNWYITINDTRIDSYHPKDPFWWEGEGTSDYHDSIPQVADTVRKYIQGWNHEHALTAVAPKPFHANTPGNNQPPE